MSSSWCALSSRLAGVPRYNNASRARSSVPLEVGKGWPLSGLKRLTVGNIMSGSRACWFSLAAKVRPLAPCIVQHKRLGIIQAATCKA